MKLRPTGGWCQGAMVVALAILALGCPRPQVEEPVAEPVEEPVSEEERAEAVAQGIRDLVEVETLTDAEIGRIAAIQMAFSSSGVARIKINRTEDTYQPLECNRIFQVWGDPITISPDIPGEPTEAIWFVDVLHDRDLWMDGDSIYIEGKTFPCFGPDWFEIIHPLYRKFSGEPTMCSPPGPAPITWWYLIELRNTACISEPDNPNGRVFGFDPRVIIEPGG